MGLNPMTGVVEGMRWAVLGTANPPLGAVLVSSAAAVVLLVVGVLAFRRYEGVFADVV
jgi:lipopolysaccharide transport system permease protein